MPARSLEELVAFVRSHTAPAPVPLVPELRLYQATELTPLWHATARELAPWDPAPFWAFPWAGGQALARFVLDRPELVRGRSVLDLATGSGLVALAAARAGAARVVAVDVDAVCAAAVRANGELQGLAVEVRIEDGLAEPAAAEVVLAGDVFYERELAARALAWMREAAGRGAVALAGDPGRVHSPAGLRELARYDVPTTLAIEGSDVLTTRVLQVDPEA